jgi:two-component system sensor histidine kinase AlgZ
MTAPPPATPQERASGAVSGFFIPDLCAAQAVFFAVLLAELAVVLHVLALGSLRDFDWQTLANASLFVQWNTLLCLGGLCALRPLLNARVPAVAGALSLLLVLMVSVLSSLLVALIFPQWLAQDLPDWVIRNALLALILAAIVLRYSYLQQRLAQQQRSALQLRLDALQARIRPHFLFNTLNSIASLIAIDAPRAEAAVEDVAELFRAALREPGGDSTVAEERHLCELYLNIEQLRLGDRLQVRWELEPGCERVALPALTLQPLVENAVYHGIARRPAGGCVQISGHLDGGRLLLSLRNPRALDTAAPARGNRMALENIRQRLEGRYGGAASLVTAERGEDFVVTLTLPTVSAA